ncbi:MAG TPA: hypothetical protein VKV95_18840 [Terriglobia bacterium]|nr:hypothetical protein [Terriglobia bacterium]
MNEAILTRAQKLYQDGRELVAEEAKLQLKSSHNIVKLATIFAGLYEIFLRKSPGESLVLVPRSKGFTKFRECMVELLRPLEREERTGWYYVSIGRHLIGKIPEAELDGLPFEKIKTLDRVMRAKGEVSPQLIARAKNAEEPAARFREEVDLMLFRGAPDHSEGPMRSLRIIAGKTVIDSIKEKIHRLRPAVAEANASLPPSDAQIIEFALADCLAGVQEAEDHVRDQLKRGKM